MKKLSKTYQVLVIFLTLTMVFIAMETASAAVQDVGPSGHTYTDISSAITAATAGDDIMVYDNNGGAFTYTENVNIDKRLNVQANGDVTITPSNPSNHIVHIQNTASGTTLQGFKLTGATGSSAIEVDADNCKVLNNQITNCPVGINLYASNEEIAGNTININGNGVLSSDGIIDHFSNNKIHDNTITLTQTSDAQIIGIYLYGDSNADIYQNIISLSHTGTGGIWGMYTREDGSNNKIHDNKITVNGQNAVGLEASQNTNLQIYSNSIESSNTGVFVRWTATGTLINFNRIIASQQYISWQDQTTLNAENNWYGTNTPEPSKFTGNVDYSPWLKMTLFQSSTTLNLGETANIMADYTINSADQNTLAIYGKHLMDGILVKFTTNLGNVGSKEAYYNTFNGVATALFRANEAAGTATITELLDGVLLSTTINMVGSSTSVNAASSISTNTVGMQNTGAPIAGIFFAALLMFAGLITPRRK